MGTGGHRFKSCHLENKALLVQLVERRFPKPNVVGSIPTGRVFVNVYKNYIIFDMQADLLGLGIPRPKGEHSIKFLISKTIKDNKLSP